MGNNTWTVVHLLVLHKLVCTQMGRTRNEYCKSLTVLVPLSTCSCNPGSIRYNIIVIVHFLKFLISYSGSGYSESTPTIGECGQYMRYMGEKSSDKKMSPMANLSILLLFNRNWFTIPPVIIHPNPAIGTMTQPMSRFALLGRTLNCLSRYLDMKEDAPVTTKLSMAIAQVIIMKGQLVRMR